MGAAQAAPPVLGAKGRHLTRDRSAKIGEVKVAPHLADGRGSRRRRCHYRGIGQRRHWLQRREVGGAPTSSYDPVAAIMSLSQLDLIQRKNDLVNSNIK